MREASGMTVGGIESFDLISTRIKPLARIRKPWT
jgi:hypothetical protein